MKLKEAAVAFVWFKLKGGGGRVFIDSNLDVANSISADEMPVYGVIKLMKL